MTEIVREAQKLTGKLEQLDNTFTKVGSAAERSNAQMVKFAATYVSLRTGFQLARAGIDAYGGAMDRANERTVEFTDEMKGLISLDQNARSIDQLNTKVLNTATAFGLSTKQVADAYFAIQSSASTLAEGIQEDIAKSSLLMSKISPVAPVDTAFALTKGMITFGKEVAGVTDLMNRMKLSADLGGQSFEDMAHYFPAAATAGHALGLGLNELLASYSLLTQVGAKVSRTGTQMRDMFNTMLDPLRSGIDFSRGWSGAMEQLAAQGTQVWSRVYGTESIEAIINLTSRSEDYFKLLEKINAAGRDQLDITKQIYQLRLKDPQIAVSETKQSAEAERKRQDLEGASGRFEMEKTAIRGRLPVWMRDWGIEYIGAAIKSRTGFGYSTDLEQQWAADERAVGQYDRAYPRRVNLFSPNERRFIHQREDAAMTAELPEKLSKLTDQINQAAEKWRQSTERLPGWVSRFFGATAE